MVWKRVDSPAALAAGQVQRWQARVEWTPLEALDRFDDDWHEGVMTWSLKQETITGTLTSSVSFV